MSLDAQIKTLSDGMTSLAAALASLEAKIDAKLLATGGPVTPAEDAKAGKSARSAKKDSSTETTQPTSTETAAPDASAKGTPTGAASGTAEAQSDAIEYSQIKDLVFKIAKEKGRQAAADLLAQFDAERGQDVAEERYAEFLAEGAKVLEGDLA